METPTNYSFNSSLVLPGDLECSDSIPARFMFMALLIVYVLLAPVFILVIYIGCTKWRKSHSGNISHSDIFTLNMAVMESLNILGLFCLYCAIDLGERRIKLAADIMYFVASLVQAFCHCVVCVERYLAVVHPVVYLRLKNKKGVVIRNISVAFMWIVSIGGTYINLVVFMSHMFQMIMGLLLNIFAFSVISFCSVCVLRALIRPAPGQGVRKSTDQSKKAAFDTIMAIMGVLVLRFSVVIVLYADQLSQSVVLDSCILFVLTFFFKLPSSLVLPLLFLQRTRKLPGLK